MNKMLPLTMNDGAVDDGMAEDKGVPLWNGEPELRQRAEYIYAMLGDLRAMADDADLIMLAYLLDMAREEAALALCRREG